MKWFQNLTLGKVPKGEPGYIRAEKKRRLLLTFLLFLAPLFIFFSSWAYLGTRESIWTIVAILGCLPACKQLVGLIMMLPRKPVDPSFLERCKEHQGKLCMGYESYMTFYEKSALIDAFAICGQSVAMFSTDEKVDCSYMATKAKEVLQGNGYRSDVHVFIREKDFLSRLDTFNEKYDSFHESAKNVKDSRYEGLSRDEAVRSILLSLCL